MRGGNARRAMTNTMPGEGKHEAVAAEIHGSERALRRRSCKRAGTKKKGRENIKGVGGGG